ncbi:hypothetical protein C2E23DRAFT_427248 [Lenzites betulinus]|nr:hypothetical protein C2E23DRAFT_427248 [Lenzites betulinus]
MPPATGPPPSLSETDHYWIEIFPPQKGSMLERYIWDVRYKGHLLGLSFSSEQEASIERAIEESTEGASVPDRLTGPPSPAAVRLHPVMGDDSESLSDGSLSPLSPRSPTSMMSDSTLIDSPSPPGNAKGYDQMELLSLDTVASLVLHGDSTTASRTTPAMFRNYRGVWVEARHDLPNDVELEDDIRVADVHQCYTVNLQWYDHPDQKMIDDGYGCSPDYNTFEMIVDTGSSVSWVVGSPCYPLDSERMEPLDRPFPPTPAASMKKCKLLENARPGWVHAPNGQRALATLMRIPQLRVRIGDCYKWIESASQILDLQLSLYFAVAYCMPHELYKMPFSGVLGLDLTAHYTEDQFKGLGNEHVPTFSTALVNQRVLKGPEQGAQAGSASQGIIYYVALRPERFDETQSFIALNRWPCRKRPVWSLNKIAVTHKDWGSTSATFGSNAKWSIPTLRRTRNMRLY